MKEKAATMFCDRSANSLVENTLVSLVARTLAPTLNGFTNMTQAAQERITQSDVPTPSGRLYYVQA